MNLNSLNKWLMLAANFGVIAGIIFLAIEVSQNQESLEEQNRLTYLTGRESAVDFFNGFRTLLLENPDLMVIWNKGRYNQELTEIEQSRYRLLCENNLWGRVTLFTRYNELGIEDEIPNLIAGMRLEIASSQNFSQCWDVWRSNNGERFSDYIRLIEGP